ncbi:hypothetical protein KV557_06535 [Kitasatospora aureofaciens]|uniref:hypothetical protein n=1 Tax=Kitasatospora aureofaciens TaxID=1894 RepID=UPI001C4598B7|nr:hypothetical protein [Kitasatospora aureofaciens]MBV6696783.1 hypothetical protein [Kitasatospora aureofaciens]
MTAFPEAFTPVRGGFVLVDPDRGTVLRTIPFQYNPDTLTRTLTPQGIGNEPGDRLEVLRLKGPAQEQFRFDAEFDATDAPEKYPDGLHPVLSALELSMYPTVQQLRHEDALARNGQIEVAPMESPLLVLVLGPRRVVPVRITEFTVTEEFFDQALNPVRAKVGVSVRVLTVDDLGHQHHGGVLYLTYQGRKEGFAQAVRNPISDVGTPRV